MLLVYSCFFHTYYNLNREIVLSFIWFVDILKLFDIFLLFKWHTGGPESPIIPGYPTGPGIPGNPSDPGSPFTHVTSFSSWDAGTG
jgi:hypothetical protein